MLSLVLQSALLPNQTWHTRSFKRKEPSPVHNRAPVQTVERLRRLQPLTASALGHITHATTGWA
jgi:hypothetical protein